MSKKKPTLDDIRKTAIGLLDNRSTDNEGMLIKRDKNVTMLDIFGTEQKTAVAYYVSDLLAKGFNNQQIIDAVNNKYGLTWKMNQVNVIKALLHKMWRCEIAHTMNDQIAREVATLDTQIKEAWEAWEFSKRGIKHTKKRTEDSESTCEENQYNITEVVNEETTTAGDVKFLQHINDLGKEKRKLLGLYAPEKKDNGGPQTAVQLNFVGEGSGNGGLNVLSQILSMGMPQQQKQVVEEQQAEVVETKQSDSQNETDIDMKVNKLMEDLLDEQYGS